MIARERAIRAREEERRIVSSNRVHAPVDDK